MNTDAELSSTECDDAGLGAAAEAVAGTVELPPLSLSCEVGAVSTWELEGSVAALSGRNMLVAEASRVETLEKEAL